MNDNDFKSHPCNRDCTNSNVMTCRYKMSIETYTTMSKACYMCPFVPEDCDRPQCITSSGFPRVLYAVNRQLPSPQIRVCFCRDWIPWYQWRLWLLLSAGNPAVSPLEVGEDNSDLEPIKWEKFKSINMVKQKVVIDVLRHAESKSGLYFVLTVFCKTTRF